MTHLPVKIQQRGTFTKALVQVTNFVVVVEDGPIIDNGHLLTEVPHYAVYSSDYGVREYWSYSLMDAIRAARRLDLELSNFEQVFMAAQAANAQAGEEQMAQEVRDAEEELESDSAMPLVGEDTGEPPTRH